MKEEIFKITKDKERAKSIFERAKDRADLIKIYPKEKIYKLVEEYYESIKELIVSLMYSEGFKTLSHVSMIEWFGKTYSFLSETELKLIDTFRKVRNGTLYYGESVNESFLKNNEGRISKILNKLIKFVGEKIYGKS